MILYSSLEKPSTLIRHPLRFPSGSVQKSFPAHCKFILFIFLKLYDIGRLRRKSKSNTGMCGDKRNPYYIIAEACVCLSAISTVFHNATLDYRRKKNGFCGKKKLSRYYSSLELWKTEYGLNFLTKVKRR